MPSKLALAVALLICTNIFSQHEMRLTSTNGVAGLEEAVVTVEYDNTATEGLLAWDVVVCSDLETISVSLGSDALFGGSEPDFLVQTILPGEGWFAGVVGSLMEPLQVVEPGLGLELHTATYQSDLPGVYPLGFCSLESQPGVSLETLVIPLGSAFGEIPTLVDGTITMEEAPVEIFGFIRGDANQDTQINMIDGVDLLNYLFISGAEPGVCLDASDFDASGTLGLEDAVGILLFMFLNGVQPQPPFPDCGLPSQLFFDCDSDVPCP